MPFADIRGLRLYHELKGAGPRVLYISGTGSDLRRKPGVYDVPGIERLSVLAYDHRGMGQTTLPDTPPALDDYTNDALALIDHVGWDSCAVVGISFGGMIAQHVAAALGDRLERLVLCCTSPGGAGGASFPLHELSALDADAFAERLMNLSDTRRDAAWRSANPQEAERLTAFYRASARDNRNDPARRKAQNEQFAARASHDAWDKLPGITAPTLVCAGRYDEVAPIERSERMVARLPDATLRVFEGGHLFFMEDPKAWPAIQNFLLAG